MIKYRSVTLAFFCFIQSTPLLAGRDKFNQNNHKAPVNQPDVAKIPQNSVRATSNQEIIAAAAQLGFVETTKYSTFNAHGQKVFKKGQTYITYDIDGHIGGFWKKFNDKKNGRLGTFDITLQHRLGD